MKKTIFFISQLYAKCLQLQSKVIGCKLSFFIMFLLCSQINVKAQSKIHGEVVDTLGKPIAHANVLLLTPKDSSLDKGMLTKEDGSYAFENIAAGKYLITSLHTGFKNSFTPIFQINDRQNLKIETIELDEWALQLKDVTVTVKKPLYEQKIDRLVINVEASPTNAGSNILEVLAKSPAINVDMDENISLNGKQGVLILIDGKNTYLSGKYLASLLKSMPASNIDQIEIMNNPPAKYEAAGMAGVINIKTKKTKNDGWNGSFSTGGKAGIFSSRQRLPTSLSIAGTLAFSHTVCCY